MDLDSDDESNSSATQIASENLVPVSIDYLAQLQKLARLNINNGAVEFKLVKSIACAEEMKLRVLHVEKENAKLRVSAIETRRQYIAQSQEIVALRDQNRHDQSLIESQKESIDFLLEDCSKAKARSLRAVVALALREALLHICIDTSSKRGKSLPRSEHHVAHNDVAHLIDDADSVGVKYYKLQHLVGKLSQKEWQHAVKEFVTKEALQKMMAAFHAMPTPLQTFRPSESLVEEVNSWLEA